MWPAVCCWWLVSAMPGNANAPQAEPILALADSLFQSARYFDAATEYERFAFRDPDDPRAGPARVMLVRAYARSGELDRAEGALAELPSGLDSLTWDAGFDLALGYARQKQYGDARAELANLQASARDSFRNRRAQRELGWLAVEQGDFAQAGHDFLCAGDSDLAFGVSRRSSPQRHALRAGDSTLFEEWRKPDLPWRNPELAVLMSSILPGAGEVYAGNVRLGLTAFAANAAVLAGVVYCVDRKLYLDAALLTTVLFGRFYAGSRSNAYDLARDFNERIRQQAARDLERRYRKGAENK